MANCFILPCGTYHGSFSLPRPLGPLKALAQIAFGEGTPESTFWANPPKQFINWGGKRRGLLVEGPWETKVTELRNLWAPCACTHETGTGSPAQANSHAGRCRLLSGRLVIAALLRPLAALGVRNVAKLQMCVPQAMRTTAGTSHASFCSSVKAKPECTSSCTKKIENLRVRQVRHTVVLDEDVLFRRKGATCTVYE